MVRRVPAVVVALVSSTFLASCGDSGGSPTPPAPPPPTPTVSTVGVTPATSTLAPGQTVQLAATAREASGATISGKTFTWSSQPTSVATVSTGGLVTAVAAGSATITASVDGRSGTATVTVTPPPVETVEVEPAASTIFEGELVQLTATLRDADGNVVTNREVTWSSSNPNDIPVDDDGLVSGLRQGNATITATSEGVSGSATVEVQRKPVASVDVTPSPATVTVGQTVQLVATARDDMGNALAGRVFLWSTSNPGVASVDGEGLVTGEGVGQAEIFATTEQVVGTAIVDVEAAPPLVITQISPSPLIEGQPATLTGTGFSTVPDDNQVTVGGAVALVTQASATMLDVVVPESACQPKRTEPVQVSALGQTSDEVDATVSPASFLTLGIGELVTLTDPADLCLQFDEQVASQRYLFGVQAVSEVQSSLTPVTVTSVIPAAAAAAAPLPLSSPAAGADGRRVDLASEALVRWTRHRAAEVAHQQRMLPELQRLQADGRFRPTPAFATAAAAIPADVEVGDEIAIKFPDFDTNTCTTSIPITVVVRKVSARGIFVEDKTSPAGGFAAADYDQMGTDLDDQIYAVDVDYLGEPSDMDANQRIVVVVTPEVNKLDSSVLAFVAGANLFPVAACPASSEGEYYYSRAPDPTGMFAAGVYSAVDARNDGRTLLAHEFAHIIQLSRRMSIAGAQFMTSYMSEGQATAIEQFSGFNFEGRTGGQNLGADVVYFGDEHDYYLFLSDLLAWFGWDFEGGKVAGAPEQCTWVGAFGDSPGPCSDVTSRMVYGPTYAIVQQSIDLFGDALGGEKAIHRAIVDHAGTPGFGTLSTVFNMPVADLLAPAAAMFLIDDRYVGGDLDDLQFRNFNLRSLENAWQDADAVMQARTRGFATFTDNVSVRAGSTAYFDVSGSNRPPTAVNVRDSSGNDLPDTFQVWVVRVQ